MRLSAARTRCGVRVVLDGIRAERTLFEVCVLHLTVPLTPPARTFTSWLVLCVKCLLRVQIRS